MENVIYKIITKILSNRLKLVVGELISTNQHAFLQGRQIGECSLLAHELLRDFSKKHGKRACLKIDLHKAFDSINREFVYFIMHCMGFPVIWINWIRECISTPSFSVLLNGSSSGFFKSNRGIRQGDPLSPYIFVLVMEFWSVSMELATLIGKIQNIKKNKDLQVSHLLFADDMLVFCRANKRSFQGINILLDSLANNTGLNINRSKRRLELIKSILFSTTAYWYSVYKLPQSTIQSLEAIFANFLWKGSIHAINWKEVCRPKSEGGFGLRKLEDLCSAAALKMLWRILNNSSLWSNWMNARYTRGKNLWDAPVNTLDSGTWKHLTSLKSTALSCVRKTIGNGETTSLWFDPWIQEGRIIDILHNVDPHLSGTENWKINGLGYIILKMSCCLLKSLLNRLSTRDRLYRFGIISTEVCVLCIDGKESIDHLFFQCPFSAYIWKLCKLKLHSDDRTIQDLRTEATATQNKFKVKDKTYILARLVLSTAVWHIWQERNRRIFHDQRLHKIMVFRRLYEDINVLIRNCYWKTGNKIILSNWGIDVSNKENI
ncbi:uncharacterized protein LOC109821509 [Asparagus officinalis]|uniref:uncharacterized protein LOC109821509 n=1 Tax=Asparagus officinalis TaxID=4686 RepID=UPI00098E8533|nr:uncharacterized protein LOC109821509 [Asparagus officinalis]